jgi:hypothetical protein
MTTKQQALRNPESCLSKARPYELIFVLRSNDPAAAQAVRLWAVLADGLHEPDKITKALALADEMDSQYSANPKAPRVMTPEELGKYRGGEMTPVEAAERFGLR